MCASFDAHALTNTYVCMYVYMYVCMDGWMGGWTDVYVYMHVCFEYVCVFSVCTEMHIMNLSINKRKRDRQPEEKIWKHNRPQDDIHTIELNDELFATNCK